MYLKVLVIDYTLYLGLYILVNYIDLYQVFKHIFYKAIQNYMSVSNSHLTQTKLCLPHKILLPLQIKCLNLPTYPISLFGKYICCHIPLES